jgi:leucine-rich repeat protein SHOC2
MQIPVEIGQLQQVQLLDLSENQITQIPAEIGQLKELYLYNNQITQIPDEIEQLRRANDLQLDY